MRAQDVVVAFLRLTLTLTLNLAPVVVARRALASLVPASLAIVSLTLASLALTNLAFAGMATAAPEEPMVLIVTRPIPARSVLAEGDLAIVPADIPGALSDLAGVLGQEARIALYPGRPLMAADIGPAALIERNQTVTLIFRQGRLVIRAEGRALARGGQGETIQAMNLGSRRPVSGRIAPDGTLVVGDLP